MKAIRYRPLGRVTLLAELTCAAVPDGFGNQEILAGVPGGETRGLFRQGFKGIQADLRGVQVSGISICRAWVRAGRGETCDPSALWSKQSGLCCCSGISPRDLTAFCQ